MNIFFSESSKRKTSKHSCGKFHFFSKCLEITLLFWNKLSWKRSQWRLTGCQTWPSKAGQGLRGNVLKSSLTGWLVMSLRRFLPVESLQARASNSRLFKNNNTSSSAPTSDSFHRSRRRTDSSPTQWALWLAASVSASCRQARCSALIFLLLLGFLPSHPVVSVCLARRTSSNPQSACMD